MGRALVVAALMMAWPVVARADELDDAVDAVASLGDDCQAGLDHATLLLEEDDSLGDDARGQLENERSLLDVLCPMLRDDGAMAQDTLAEYRACYSDCDDLQTAVWFVLKKTSAEAEAMQASMIRIQAIGNGESVTTDEPSEPSTHTISLSTVGISIEVPGTWEASVGDGADLIYRDGENIGAVIPQSEYDCVTTVDGVGSNYDEHRDVTISLPYAWNGLEYVVGDEWAGIFCRDHDGVSVVVSAPAEIAAVLIAGIEAALSPAVDYSSTTDDTGGGGGDSMPVPETPHRRTWIGGFKPRTAQLALVRRSDEMGTGFGFGLQLGRLGWREGERITIGYEVGAAATSGFWNLSAQVRPGVSPTLSDLPVDAYLALGVDVVGGDHQPETDVAPVGGVGAEVLFTLPGLGADLAAQVLADPGGFHSYLLHGGLLFGAEEGRFRVGASYVKSADDSSALWMTLGLTMLELD